MTPSHCIELSTDWGLVAVVVNAEWAPIRIILPDETAPKLLPRSARPDAPGDAALLCRWIERYLAGERPPLPAQHVVSSWLTAAGSTAFRVRCSQALCAVPYGTLVTYGELAVRAGSPGAARAAGAVCARNPFPLLIPCHRVVPATGGPGRYSGGGGVATKVRLWQLEGATTEQGTAVTGVGSVGSGL